MNHKYDSQLITLKNYYKNTINYHRHNTQKSNTKIQNNSFSLSDKKYITKIELTKW